VLRITLPAAAMDHPAKQKSFDRRTKTMWQARSVFPRGVALRAACALTLLSGSSALAQTGAPQANAAASAQVKQAIAPKQVGVWTVIGWNRGNVASHCSAERPVRGGAGDGATLQFALVRWPGGYRIALGSDEWELTPQTAFPVELVAAPVFRSDANALAIGPKIVMIELGAELPFMQKLATAPQLDIKTAQTVLKLPLEGFSSALAEVDACFASLKRPGANPFAAPTTTSKPTAALPQNNPPASGAAPTDATKVNTVPVNTPAAARGNGNPDSDLIEERRFLTVQTDNGSYRLEALVVRPAKADGRLPIALITHGKNLKSTDNSGIRADMMLPQARDFAARGWLAAVVIRRGYGQSDGVPGVSRGSAYMACDTGNLARGFDVEADDLDGALKALATRPDADPSRVIAVGQSLGGGVVLAFAARRPAGLIGVVNVSGGVWRTKADGSVCDFAELNAAMASFGARTRIPTLWLYAENDTLFPPDVAARMRDAYTAAGGRAELQMFPPVLQDGHRLFADFSGRVKWLRAVDRFLATNHMPNANLARIDSVIAAAKLAPGTRPVVEEYLSTPAPKLLVATTSGGAYWVANQDDIAGARTRVLTRCREKSGAECIVVMENNELVTPVVTGAATPQVTTH
jgi:dienelactone hydrolase